MRRGWPGLRFRLSTLGVLVALCALATWGGLYFLSPTRRLARQIRADRPTYLRREAVGGLGSVPSWETEEAIDVLLGALRDPSPRVRENALGGLGAHGVRARRAIPAILRFTRDGDRGVRYSACAVLGLVLPKDARGAERDAVVGALKRALEDVDPQNHLGAAVALLLLGEEGAAYPALALLATDGAEHYLRPQARLYVGRHGTKAGLIAATVPLVRSGDPARRLGALELLAEIAPPATVRKALRDALRDDDPGVRRWAAEKLRALTPEPDDASDRETAPPAPGESVPPPPPPDPGDHPAL